jgi:hypothetical protein
MSEPNQTDAQQKRGLDAVPMTVVGLALIVFAAFWLSGQPAQLSTRILQTALAAWAFDKVVSLIKGLIADLRGQEAMEKIATGGHWIATLLAGAVVALLAVGLASIVMSYAGSWILAFFDIKV